MTDRPIPFSPAMMRAVLREIAGSSPERSA